MGNRHHTWFRTWKGKNLFMQEWMIDRPTAVVGVIHGQSDHSSRFTHVAEALNNAGYGVAAIDLIGHGRSEGKRGHVSSFHDYISQVGLLHEHLKSSGLPVFLYGQSMGGLIVLSYAQHHPENVAGVISSSPWLKLAFEPPAWRVALGKVVLRIAPGLVQPAELDLSALAHPEQVQLAYKNDPLVHGKISPAAYFGIVEAGEKWRREWPVLKMPVLLLHGNADRITDHTSSASYADTKPANLTYREFAGLYHELHNEVEQEEVFTTVLDWLQQQISNK
ncbi:MAG: lysophospholipase [Chitinophagales bacterium]|nr:lysophospholipase [Chitinophagales bacterium]HAE13977.1 lysophospholipase [Bacteroidota bacterium]MCB9020724.1 lysophospholipase [Chitinophagales bacterium]MCB9031357.1 lysophospholipase [Chitinophagales bacterium]HAE35026.1 lysophospholipase [Bacteroidota bacterium]